MATGTGDRDFDRTVRGIELVCLSFAALGLTLPLAYSTPLLAPYRGALGTAIGDAALATSSRTLELCLGMTGGTIAGKWIAHYAVARLGLRARWRWAREATLAGLVGWLVVDTTVSIASGAWPSVVLSNSLPLLLLAPLLARVWSRCDREEPRARPRLALRASRIAMGIGVASGLVVALLGDGAPFATWRELLGAAHFEGTLPEPARALVRWFLGPIGGATVGQFLLLAYLVRHAPSAGERPALGWALASLLAWFVIDSAWSLASGSLFNVVMVNVPAILVSVAPIAWALATLDRGTAMR